MHTKAIIWTTLLAAMVGLVWADSPNESTMSGEALARTAAAFVQAQPPNLEMAQDRLKDALEKAQGLDVNALKLAQQALEAGVPQAVPPLVAKAVGDDPAQTAASRPVEVKLGFGIYWAFAVGLLLVFWGAYALGRNAASHTRTLKEA